MTTPATTTGVSPGNDDSQATAAAARRPIVVATWIQLNTLALSLAGLGVSLYLTIAHYTTATTLACPDTWRANWPALRWARLGSLIAGVAFVLYLIYTELFTLNAICLWCTSIHVITILLFALVVPTAARFEAGQNIATQPH